jgi:hypothetical protein
MAPLNPTMKNLPKQNPPLEIITRFGDGVLVTLDRPSKAELGLLLERQPGAQSIANFPAGLNFRPQ